MNVLAPARARLSPGVLHRSPPRVSPSLPRGGSLAIAGLLGAIALSGCGAGGDDTPSDIRTRTEQGQGPVLGGNGGASGAAPIAGGNCEGLTCDLATDGSDGAGPLGCGDGVLADDEACDDGNEVSGDGCNAQCLVAEPGFSCAAPGQPCRAIARCGDGVVAPTEQCDDANTAVGDGCSDRCRIEFGKKCEAQPGQPSVCTDAECGNNIKEGAEACDDGNNDPFDGCSPICLKEPNCEGLSCTSDCGDGLLIDEECDDGNLIDGDGCSSTCARELGFTCVAQAACEEIAGRCVLRVPAIFRDFSEAHPDFGNKALCTDLVPGALAQRLAPSGRPQLSGTPASTNACIESAASFADWYTDNPRNVSVVGELLLFDNDAGGYVNRFGAQGEPFEAVDADTERGGGGASLATCAQACVNEATNSQGPFQGLPTLQCNNNCRALTDARQQLTVGRFAQLNNQLTQAQNAAVPDADAITALEADIADVELEIAQLTADADACLTDCQTELARRLDVCTATCKPCSYAPDQFCLGGELLSFDGSPVFFPVDDVTGPTASSYAARIPDQYGFNGFPAESVIFPGAPNHNFHFTSEVQYWFKYEAETQATLEFLGDDDVWVFLNGVLAVDLGGIHVPSEGSIVIDAPAGSIVTTIADGREVGGVRTGVQQERRLTPNDFGLVDGNVYTISIFHAERQVDGSSFKLTLAGFEAAPSVCSAECGDEILSFGEECDDGDNDGGYNECGEGCVLGPFCGDSIVQPEFGETCDVGPGGSATCRGCREITIR